MAQCTIKNVGYKLQRAVSRTRCDLRLEHGTPHSASMSSGLGLHNLTLSHGGQQLAPVVQRQRVQEQVYHKLRVRVA